MDGCPLNGVWQIEICDLLPSDNGFVFDACINFEIGCTDPSACNFDISATQDDGSCLEEDALGVCGGECPSDINSNGICDDAEINGCTYQFAENYNPLATDDDGSCILDDPGDSSCELVYDGNADGSVGADDLLGLLTEFGAECTPLSAFICGNPISYQGYDYATVLIGEQCWFTGNLRSENYENGDAIPSILSDSDWENTTSGAVAVYGAGGSPCDNQFSSNGDVCDELLSLNEYGRLYNWYAVDDARGLCPSGWHVPSDEEWTVMTDHLGGESVAGSQMKSNYGWYNGVNGTNSSGFSGLPGGYRSPFGIFSFAGRDGHFWSSSPNGSDAWFRVLTIEGEGVYRNDGNPRRGYSVRCVRGAE